MREHVIRDEAATRIEHDDTVVAGVSNVNSTGSGAKGRAPQINKFSGYLVMLLGVWMLALAVFAGWFANVFTV